MKTTKTDLSKKGSVAKKIKPTLPSEITKRKRAEKALEEERNLLRTLMDNLPDTIYFKDAESRFIRVIDYGVLRKGKHRLPGVR